MAGETRGSNEQKVWMATLEHKFNNLLAFVHMMVKRDAEMGNQKRKDGKSANGKVSEGRPHINMDPLPRPPIPPKPEGKDSQVDGKIDSLEEKIRPVQGLNSFGNTDFFSMSWFPNMTVPPKFKAPKFKKYNGRRDPMIHLQMYCRKMVPYVDNEPLLIQTFQGTLIGHTAEWHSQLKKISHWKRLANTFLASMVSTHK
jgi:hypothetical protein